MFRRFLIPLLLVSIALLGVSCVRFVGPEDIRHDLSDQAGVKLKQETGFTFTRSAVWLARHFVKEEDFTLGAGSRSFAYTSRARTSFDPC